MSSQIEITDEMINKALNNDDNVSLLKLNTSKIKSIKNDLFQKLHFSPSDIKILLKKLKEYRFVDEIDDIHFGRYIRWINIKDPENLKLTNGGVICSIKVSNDEVIITCRNKLNRMFSLRMNEALIFQRLTNEEQLILSIMDYMDK